MPPLTTIAGQIPTIQLHELTTVFLELPEPGFVKDEAEIMRFVPEDDAPMHVYIPFKADVAFAEIFTPGQPEPMSVMGLLDSGRRFIREQIVEPLRPFL